MLRQSWFLMKAQPSHPGYRPMRLKTRDYSLSGLYFVTICASQRRCVLGRIEKEQVELTALGHIARESWIAIPLHFARVNLHSFVIMSNNFHGVIEISATVLPQHPAPLHRKPHSLSQDVQ